MAPRNRPLNRAGSAWVQFLLVTLVLSGGLPGIGNAAAAYRLQVVADTTNQILGFAYALNDHSQVVGDRFLADVTHGFRWSPPTALMNLGILGGSAGYAAGINNRGQVVGRSLTATGHYHAFLWSYHSLSPQPVIWDLGTLGGTYSEAQAINLQGEVVGAASDDLGRTLAFLWTPALGMQSLGTLGGRASAALGINDSGQVVGESWVAPGGPPVGECHAFLWTAQTGMRDLGTLGGAHSRANAINNRSQVAGQSWTAAGREHAFLWSPELGMLDLGVLPGAGWSQAYALNNSGQVVGSSHNRAVLWRDGVTRDLNQLVVNPLPGFTLDAALGINQDGEIAANAVDDRGNRRACLLLPLFQDGQGSGGAAGSARFSRPRQTRPAIKRGPKRLVTLMDCPR